VKEDGLDRLEVLDGDRDAEVVGDVHRVHDVEITQREAVGRTEAMRGGGGGSGGRLRVVTLSHMFSNVFEEIVSDGEWGAGGRVSFRWL
jgi:hypothetical protein